jgi:hypothetical protein
MDAITILILVGFVVVRVAWARIAALRNAGK